MWFLVFPSHPVGVCDADAVELLSGKSWLRAAAHQQLHLELPQKMSPITLRTRGQTIVLGVLTLLMLALMMMLTFTLNQVVHEKIRIQSHSDAIAYSTAVIEARAFNSIVYSNRAIAAAVVAQMTVHAWMSTATATTATLFSGMTSFGIIAVYCTEA